MRAHHSPARRGFSLAEMMIAVTLMVMVFAIAVPFFRAQTRAMARSAGTFDAQQNLDAAALRLDQELRATGNTGDTIAQPSLVQAQGDAITINADLVSRTSLVNGAYYLDSSADAGVVEALTRLTPVTLPRSSWTYPGDSASWVAGAAETVSFWVEPDTGGAFAGPAGTWRMMRRVNRAAATPVARGILYDPAQPVFTYFVRDSSGRLRQVPAAQLPLRHADHIHRGVGEQLASRRIDSIRVVRVRLTTVHRDAQRGDVQRTMERTIRMPNMGIARYSTCGDRPASPVLLVADSLDAVNRTLRLRWSASGDEGAGDNDVERYTLFRRPAAASQFGADPLASVAGAAMSTYGYVDTAVPAGSWVYGVAAMDCGQLLSTIRASGSITMP